MCSQGTDTLRACRHPRTPMLPSPCDTPSTALPETTSSGRHCVRIPNPGETLNAGRKRLLLRTRRKSESSAPHRGLSARSLVGATLSAALGTSRGVRAMGVPGPRTVLAWRPPNGAHL